MAEAMVTGRMSQEKKRQGARILQDAGLNTSQAINLLFDKLIEEQSASFLSQNTTPSNDTAWKNATEFVDTLSSPHKTRFDSMTKAETKTERLKHRKALK